MATYGGKNLKSHTRASSPPSRLSNVFISEASKEKSNTSMFSLSLAGVMLFGIATMFLCKRYRNITWALVFLCLEAIFLIVSSLSISGNFFALKSKDNTGTRNDARRNTTL